MSEVFMPNIAELTNGVLDRWAPDKNRSAAEQLGQLIGKIYLLEQDLARIRKGEMPIYMHPIELPSHTLTRQVAHYREEVERIKAAVNKALEVVR